MTCRVRPKEQQSTTDQQNEGRDGVKDGCLGEWVRTSAFLGNGTKDLGPASDVPAVVSGAKENCPAEYDLVSTASECYDTGVCNILRS